MKALAAQKSAKTIFTKAESIFDLGVFSIPILRSDHLDHLDLAIAKNRKRTESACCAISVKTFANQTVLMASVIQKTLALSAESMDSGQRALHDGSVVENNNDSPTYGIRNRTVDSFSKRSTVSGGGKNKPLPSIVVNDIDKGSKSSDGLENRYDGIQNVETTDSDNHVGNDDNTVN